jgi:NADPH:quinone reductase-like Zn-dependent oxidoreductase
MKAIRIHQYGGPEVLVYEDAPKPVMAPDDVLIKVCAAGVNPVDWKIREGLRKNVRQFQFPFVLGWDVSGIVEEVGNKASGFKKGDEVYSKPDLSRGGTYAEYVAVKASEVALKPKTLDHVRAAGVPLAALTAWQALFDKGELKEGERVLILGASGGVGSFAVQLAKWKKAVVIGVCSTKNVDFLKSLGVDVVIDYTTTRFEDELNNLDMVLDNVGGEVTSRAWKVLKEGGKLVSITGTPDINDARALGKMGIGVGVTSNAEELKQITNLIDSNAIKPFITSVLPLYEAKKAQDLLQNGRNLRGKIVLKIMA